MALNHTLLGLLASKPMTGYQLKQVFDSSINYFWNAHMSQIYRELSSMEEKGWVTFVVEPQTGKPDKKIYSIAPAGMTVLRDWLRNFPENMEETTRNEFLARVFFASYLDLPDLVYQFRRFVRKQQERLTVYSEREAHIGAQREQGDSRAVFWRLVLRRGVKEAEAALEWAQECLEVLEEMERKQ